MGAAQVASTDGAVSGASGLKDYKRIIAFSPAVTEIIYALGAQDRLVGIASFSDYPPEARKEKPLVGGILNIDSEKIVWLRPDLVISPPGAVASEKLPAFGADVRFLPDKTLADVKASFVEIGRLVGRPGAGLALAERLSESVNAARERHANATLRSLPIRIGRRSTSATDVPALVVIGYEPMWVAGGCGVVDELLDAAGGSNVAGKVKKDFYAMDFETVIASAPELIIDLTLDAPSTPKRREAVLAFWKRFPIIPAVKNARIEFIDSDLLTIPGPRLVEGLAQLEALIDEAAPVESAGSTGSAVEGGRP